MSEEDWAQLKEAAISAQVVKVKVNVLRSDQASETLAAGFNENPLLREVELGEVPFKSVELVRGILCTNTALTVKVSDKFIL